MESVPVRATHNNNFNFLRLLFASLVLVSHAPELRDGDRHRELLSRLGGISFGELAVQGFFLLSGYLIVSSWWRKPQLKPYFESRIRRIVPGFWVAFVLSVVVVGVLSTHQATASYFASLDYLALTKEALRLQPPEAPHVFDGQPYPVLNGALYTIAYEFRCYILVALLGLVGLRSQKYIWLTLLLASLGLLYFSPHLENLAFPGRLYLFIDVPTFVRLLTFFAAGATFHLFRPWLVLDWKLAALAGVLVLVFLLELPQFTNFALATAGAYALFWFAFADLPLLDRFKHWADASYGLYLYGWPIQKLLNWYFPNVSPWVLLLVAVPICVALGLTSWYLVESRFLKRKQPRPA
ncbi:MAG: acyltransferase [Hymenobacter sp.]|nr:MAG: acyltransferase [Hymenobacter sp.]